MSTEQKNWEDLASDPEDEPLPSSAQDSADKLSVQSQLPPRMEKFDENTGIRTIVSYELIDENTDGAEHLVEQGYNARKITQKFRVEVRKVRKAVASRKKLRKFGLAANDAPGPNPSTTSCKEEIEIQYGVDEFGTSEGLQEPDSDVLDIGRKQGGGLGIQCLYCKQGHLSQNCPSKPDTVVKTISAEKSDRYVPPNRRPGASGPADTFPPTSRQVPARRSDEPTIRVTNLPEDVRDSDLRELFQSFGRITRTFMPRDRTTNRIRGFAFVTFDTIQAAMTAVKVMNNYGYAHLVLGVEIAERRN
ncbi:hypothetical protein ACOME3_001959 [Neoechinorhynchus agilis]